VNTAATGEDVADADRVGNAAQRGDIGPGKIRIDQDDSEGVAGERDREVDRHRRRADARLAAGNHEQLRPGAGPVAGGGPRC